MLTEIFAVAGPVQHVKIIPDRNYQHGGLNYGFVEYMDMRAAETALQTLNGRKIFDTEIRVNWAYQGNQNKEDTTNHFHVFVGDLSPEVNDEVLRKAFGAFGTLSDARVMWDMNSGKSRGYGFLAFRDRTDAEQAIATMNGEWLGSRAIRVNWANQKTQGAPAGVGGSGPADLMVPRSPDGSMSGMGGMSGMSGMGGMGGMGSVGAIGSAGGMGGAMASPMNYAPWPGVQLQHNRLRRQPGALCYAGGPHPALPVYWIPPGGPHAVRPRLCLCSPRHARARCAGNRPASGSARPGPPYQV
jgi:nucleolysin TIA-1/TIAR